MSRVVAVPLRHIGGTSEPSPAVLLLPVGALVVDVTPEPCAAECCTCVGTRQADI